MGDKMMYTGIIGAIVLFAVFVFWNAGPMTTGGCALIGETQEQILKACGRPNNSASKGDLSFYRYNWLTSFSARTICFEKNIVTKVNEHMAVEWANTKESCGWE